MSWWMQHNTTYSTGRLNWTQIQTWYENCPFLALACFMWCVWTGNEARVPLPFTLVLGKWIDLVILITFFFHKTFLHFFDFYSSFPPWLFKMCVRKKKAPRKKCQVELTPNACVISRARQSAGIPFMPFL